MLTWPCLPDAHSGIQWSGKCLRVHLIRVLASILIGTYTCMMKVCVMFLIFQSFNYLLKIFMAEKLGMGFFWFNLLILSREFLGFDFCPLLILFVTLSME